MEKLLNCLEVTCTCNNNNSVVQYYSQPIAQKNTRTHAFGSESFSNLRPESVRDRVRETGTDCGPRLLTVTHTGF